MTTSTIINKTDNKYHHDNNRHIHSHTTRTAPVPEMPNDQGLDYANAWMDIVAIIHLPILIVNIWHM